MLIADIMTPTIVTARPEDTVRRALLLLEDQDIRHLPVIDDERNLVGLVSDRDLREYRLPVMEELEHPDQADDLLDTPLSEVMNSEVVSVDSGEDVVAAIDLMIEYRVGALPVLDGRELVGIVSYVDLLRLARDVLAAG
ncbi:MAG TPA: CBS domain-containing protein [Nannocystaceae bacterium]|nr:CBS domain-containing protein [Nannocystaceae bacterium]